MQKIEAYALKPQAKRLLTLLRASRNNAGLSLEDKKEFLRSELAKPENADLKEDYIDLVYSMWQHRIIIPDEEFMYGLKRHGYLSQHAPEYAPWLG